MKLELLRFCSGPEDTIGLLFDVSAGREFLCFTLEDQHQPNEKVPGETRIPAGTYRITLRTEGGKHTDYARRFSGMHRGTLWVRDVPGFNYILIHVGNDEDDTGGCLLVGDQAKRGYVGQSAAAYRRIYPPIADTLHSGGRVDIEVVDFG